MTHLSSDMRMILDSVCLHRNDFPVFEGEGFCPVGLEEAEQFYRAVGCQLSVSVDDFVFYGVH